MDAIHAWHFVGFEFADHGVDVVSGKVSLCPKWLWVCCGWDYQDGWRRGKERGSGGISFFRVDIGMVGTAVILRWGILVLE